MSGDVERFERGDVVRLCETAPAFMSHFDGWGEEAVVVGTYASQYGGENHNDLTLFFRHRGASSWYYASQCSLVERGTARLAEWEAEHKAECDQAGNLDWIFENGTTVATRPHGASIAALARCFGLTNLWGARGEGIDYYANARGTMRLATPFLERGDKAEWLAYCETLKGTVS